MGPDLNNGLPEGYSLDDNFGLPEGYSLEGVAPTPTHENFLQKAIRAGRSFGQLPITGTGMLPSSMQEIMDVGKVGIKNNLGSGANFPGLGSSGFTPIQWGANMSDPTGSFKAKIADEQFHEKLSPETQYGKNLDVASIVAPFAMLGLEGATAGAKGIGRLFNKAPIQEEIALNQEVGGNLSGEAERLGKVKDYLGTRGKREAGYVKNEERGIKELFNKEAKSFAYEGKKGIKTNVSQQFDEARKNYRDMLQSLESENVGMDDLVNVLDKTIEEKNILAKEFPTPEEQRLIQMRFKAAGKIPEAQPSPIINPKTNQPFDGPTPEMTKIQDPRDFKSFRDEVLRSIGSRADLEGEFLKHYGDMLEAKGLGEFRAANSQYRSAYEAFNSSKGLTEPELARIALGKSAPSKVSDLASAESKIGTNYVRQGSTLSQKYKGKQADLANKRKGVEQRYGKATQDLTGRLDENEMAQGLAQDRMDMLLDQLEAVMRRRKIAAGVGLTALGGGAFQVGGKIVKGIHDIISGHE